MRAALIKLGATLTRLRELRRRVALLPIDAEDRALFDALSSMEIARCERRQARMLAKLGSDAEDGEGEAPGPIADADAEHADAHQDEDGGDAGASGAAGSTSDPGSPESAGGPTATEPESKGKGHGRNGAGAFVNAKHVFHTLLVGVIGAICEACGIGRMLRYREKCIVVVKGQPLFGAELHHFEQGRCRLCGAIIRAEGPAVTGGLGGSYITYDGSACAMLLVMHYFAGVPFKRMESLQAGWGIPMPDANQWTLADESADRLLPLYKALEKHGVQNALALRIDDTGSMIVAVQREIRAEVAAVEALGGSAKDVRTGINATGVYLETAQGKVLLFFTGRHHAGEIIDRILAHRSAAQREGEKLVKVSDAASKNFSHAHRDALDEAVCNAHAYLNFRAVKDRHPEEYGLAGEVYDKVFDNDDVTKARGVSPHDRMLYHREHSLPEMRRLKAMCRDKLDRKLVEPNAPLWAPLTFIINQWERLTRFCEVPGVPLDTNVVEQMLIIPVRYLAGSFNYRTQSGAEVGDLHMSLIATANANGIEPVAYLTECIENHEDLAKRPEHYLPWVYRARLEAPDETGHEPPAAPTRSAVKRAVEHPLRPGTLRPSITVATGPPSAARP